jgi:rhodanese-related sulfurtransferase
MAKKLCSIKGSPVKRITNILYWIAMAGLLFYFSYTKGWILANFNSISPKQAETLILNHDNLTLLDVRTIEEYKSGHIRGAKLIPLNKLEANLDKLKADRDKKIIVYCRSGNRSVAASRILKKHGFVPLNVKQGMVGLLGTELEVVK